MKQILKYLLLVICLSPCKGYFQNFISNSSFEVISGTPTDQGQADKATFWKDNFYLGNENGPIYYHSPDLYTPNASFTQPTTPAPSFPTSAHSGSNYVGMQPYELIQQSFDASGFQAGKSYTFSAWIWLANNDPTWWNNVALNVFLAENTVSYVDNTSHSGGIGYQTHMCSSDYVSYDFTNNPVILLGTQNLDLSSYPTGQWHQIAFIFNAPATHATLYNHLVVDLVKPGFGVVSNPCNNANIIAPCSLCEGGYMFVDDVTIKPSMHCDSYCTNKINGITIDSNGGGFQTGWEASCVPFAPDIKNAIGINLTVIERNQSVVVGTQSAFDINGLQDTGFPDYEFTYFGTSNIAVDSYVFEVEIFNCHEDKFYYPVVTNIGGNCGIPEDNTMNAIQADCCPQNDYFENQTLSGANSYGVDQNIYVGVNSGGTTGVVTIAAGSVIEFSAGQNVIVEPGGLTVQPGGFYTAVIQPCVSGHRQEKSTRRVFIDSLLTDSIQNKITTILTANSKRPGISVNPNPSNGMINLVYNKDVYVIDAIEVYSIEGGKVYSLPWNMNNSSMDLSPLNNGVYYLKILSAGVSLKTEKIVIVK